MFYIPEEQNSQYSQGFRKLVKRVIDRLQRQQNSISHQTPQKARLPSNVHNTHTITRNQNQNQNINNMNSNNEKKCKKQYFMDHKRLVNMGKEQQDGQHMIFNFKQTTNSKIVLPKLNASKRMKNFRGEQLSQKFIRSSEVNIRKMFDFSNRNNITCDSPTNENPNKSEGIGIGIMHVKSFARKRSPKKVRKMRSECVEEVEREFQKKRKMELEEIAPWALNVTATQYFG